MYFIVILVFRWLHILINTVEKVGDVVFLQLKCFIKTMVPETIDIEKKMESL